MKRVSLHFRDVEERFFKALIELGAIEIPVSGLKAREMAGITRAQMAGIIMKYPDFFVRKVQRGRANQYRFTLEGRLQMEKEGWY